MLVKDALGARRRGERSQPAAEGAGSGAADYQPSGDSFLDHYFKRIDPDVAASFSPEQRTALKRMFGSRGAARHLFELRRSVPFGRKRFYLVVLFGNERRSLMRLMSRNQNSAAFVFLFYLAAASLLLLPVLVAYLGLSAAIDFPL
ncbi:MAG: hypothetical protein ACREDZ_12440 [Kiloniellales bacterium]